jgi:RNA polymerase sigma factor (sigma-70 family)
MKYEYITATGKNEIEVEGDWGSVLMELDRLEYNNNQTEMRRHASLEAFDPDGTLFSSDTDIQAEHEIRNQLEALRAAISKLPLSQQELIRAVLGGMSLVDYAKKKRVSKAAVSQQMERIRKQLIKYLL